MEEDSVNFLGSCRMVTLFLLLFGFVFMVTLKSVLHILFLLKSREESDSP